MLILGRYLGHCHTSIVLLGCVIVTLNLKTFW
jgi:hypothetical protein